MFEPVKKVANISNQDDQEKQPTQCSRIIDSVSRIINEKDAGIESNNTDYKRKQFQSIISHSFVRKEVDLENVRYAEYEKTHKYLYLSCYNA